MKKLFNKIVKKIYKKFVYILDKPIRRATKEIIVAEFIKSKALESDRSIIVDSARNPKITVSLTTFGRRIDSVFLTLESIAQQTLRPDRVVLWLAENEFDDSKLPITLQNFQRRGLTIKYCDDIKSYKKIIPTLKEFPKDIIITIDDDWIYPFDLIENLYKTYIADPKTICCYRAHLMTFKKSGEIKDYMDWKKLVNIKEPSMLIFPTSGGGALYFPNCFHQEILNKELFMKLAPSADDVWLKFMSYMNGVKCKTVEFNYNRAIPIDSKDINPLFHYNIEHNDTQIRNVMNYFNIKFDNNYIKFDSK